MKYIITFQYSDEGGKEYLRNFNVDYIDGQFDIKFDNLKDFESHISFIRDRYHIKLGGSQYGIEKELTDINTDGITHIFVVKNDEDIDKNVPRVDWNEFITNGHYIPKRNTKRKIPEDFNDYNKWFLV